MILRVFFDDIKAIISRFFVAILVGGILLVPSMYAGINIYASSDPYANTGNLEVAVASEDKGMTLSDGRVVNSPEEVMDDLKDDDSVDWCIEESSKKAIEGVRSGKYYAAVVFKDGFTKDMHDYKHVLSQDKAPMIYYTNVKKNAVAAKITDSVISSLADEINKKYIKRMLRHFYKSEKSFYDETDPMGSLNTAIEEVKAIRAGIKSYSNAVDGFEQSLGGIRNNISDARKDNRRIKAQTSAALSVVREDIDNAKAAADRVVGLIDKSKLLVDPDRFDSLIKSAEAASNSVDPLLASADEAASGAESSLLQLKETFDSLDGELVHITKLLKKIKRNQKKEDNMFENGDAKSYGSFFASPVEISKTAIYPEEPYGVAMTPFYCVLSLWVGAVVLVSLINTHVDRIKYPGITEGQCYFGRIMIFVLLGQLQAVVLLLVNLFLLHCDPTGASLMWGALALSSLVFVVLIYSITLSFGDVGKGIIVVLMVMQIAGSGGSYPIEILPEVFGLLYRFFPMPYAINAMREAIFGVYENDYIIYLARLLVFLVPGLIIGLFIRRDFEGVDHFVREKLEESEVL